MDLVKQCYVSGIYVDVINWSYILDSRNFLSIIKFGNGIIYVYMFVCGACIIYVHVHVHVHVCMPLKWYFKFVAGLMKPGSLHTYTYSSE